ncbi:hypothetical protein C8R41DRAFT_852168 [Lentinula lateritia]|uniref:Secreted protein n=1 Tax=Lentinula lateritia TaxID=40482 RepID=A0ABQ8V5Y1_9AGAR|nr:hypothetical protein C8R41DRAFT_852168 [Lentinula lateritia]
MTRKLSTESLLILAAITLATKKQEFHVLMLPLFVRAGLLVNKEMTLSRIHKLGVFGSYSLCLKRHSTSYFLQT